MNIFREFNRNFSQHSHNRSMVLRELTSFLKFSPEQFVIENATDSDYLSLVEFFRKLNDILLTDDLNYDYHWVVLQVIEIAIKDANTMQYLGDTVRIITGISSFAVKKASSLTEGKQIQLWTLVNRITIGMSIDIEEPYIASLIEHLVKSIKTPDLQKDIKLLQVSTLTNLCFKNDIAVICLLKFTKSKELLCAIQEARVFWCKLAMAMARFDCRMLDFELVCYLKSTFHSEYFAGLIRGNDWLLLHHILELLVVCCERDEYSRQILQQFDFRECIGAALAVIDDSEIKLQISEPVNLFLGIVNSILAVSNTSLEPHIPQLFKLIIDRSDTTYMSSEAIKTIRSIQSSSYASYAKESLVKVIIRFIENMYASPHTNLSAMTELYRLLCQLHAKQPDIFKELPDDIVAKSIDTDVLSFGLSDSNLSMQIHRLQWLFTYTKDIASDGGKLADVMKMKDVHNIFANGLRSCDEEILALTIDLMRSEYFPVQAVSKIISGAYNPSIPKENRNNSCRCQCQPTVEVVRPHFSTALETRLNTVISRVSAKLENSSVDSGDDINLLRYQNIIASAKEETMQRQIKSLSDQITIQSNEIGMLKLAIRNGLTKINERETRIENLNSNVEQLSTTLVALNTKYDNVRDMQRKYVAERKEMVRDITAKEQQISELQIQHRTELDKQEAKHKSDLDDERAKLIDQHQRHEKKLKAAHDRDLEKYSTKLTEMENKFELDKANILKRQAKDQKASLIKIEHLEKQVETLTKKEIELLDNIQKLDVYKNKYEQMLSVFNK